MVLTLFNILYVLIAVAMTILILLQRGAGAQAGSGFGGGASGTVFGSRGASNFLSRSTAILATIFFLLSLAMAWYLKNAGTIKTADDLGVMGALDTPKATVPATPAATTDIPAAPATGPVVPATKSDVPAAPAVTTPPVKQEDTPAKRPDAKAETHKEAPKKP
ncbi:MAG: preprotein translocase subunit SecG [Proteobacteria bacterium]|uniref:preprotein translocase subunit SecG n=1 Tax=Rudaea sp. TaxID=2136325 RepID=UPI001D3C27B0|nr:preprotein translocase subunit SecG [Pseudomonadota bacterium]MBS0567309.1 preprotein translocase subunit SecG [Pseudomonadota bacterium]